MIKKTILTVDVEDWTVSSLHLLPQREAAAALEYLPAKDAQVERGVRRFLDFLEEKKLTATFFVLGRTARAHKGLVRLIHNRGHEIGSHSMTHTLFTGLSPAGLKDELMESKSLLEDIVGAPVQGFRAPNLNPYPDVPVFFEQLQIAGYRYDSSFTGPAAEAAGGKNETGAAAVNNGILEFPVTAMGRRLAKIPLGGTWLKLMHPFLVSARLKKVSAHRNRQPAVLYFHPYEIDQYPLCWPHPSQSPRARFSLLLRNTGKGRHMKILDYLSRRHCFTSVREYVRTSCEPATSPP